MADEKKTLIYIDDAEYVFEDLNPEQQALVKHCADLDQKIGGTEFSLDQLRVAKQAFVEMLKKSLETKEEVSE